MSDLTPMRHPQMDIFVADIMDASPKDDLGSMEHPMFALKAGDKAVRRYEHRGATVEVIPSILGLATIHDKDVLIYCTSQIVEALNRGREISRTVRITAHDLLVTCNRDTGGKGYKELQAAFDRLKGTMVKTNIQANGARIKDWFSLVDRIRVVEKSPTNERMIAVEITLSEWLFNAIRGLEVLTLNPDYFRIRKPLERRLYEIARKHCGAQPAWNASLEVLYKKSGSRGSLKEFKRILQGIVKSQHLPDYRIVLTEDNVSFYNRDPKGNIKQINDLLSGKIEI